MTSFSRRARLLLCLAVLVAPTSLGCSGPGKIPNTEIDATSENRKVVDFCENYRKAVEERDVETLLAMASPRYFETGGNAKPSDDIDFNGLRQYLTTKFRMTKAIRYEIKYLRIHETDTKIIQVDYRYTASFRIPTSEGDSWRRAVRDHRLQLVREGDGYRILAGM